MVTSVGVILPGKGMREPFWSDGNVLHTDLAGGHTGLHICEKSSGCTEVMCIYSTKYY